MLFYISELQCATARHTRTVDNVILGENKLTFQLCSFSVKSVPGFLYKYLIRERNTGREGVTDRSALIRMCIHASAACAYSVGGAVNCR